MRRAGAWSTLLGCLWAGSGLTDQPPADASRAASPPSRAGHEQAQPDDAFLEFLGRDDVEDAKWWEFFKQHRPHPRDAAEEPPLREGERS